MGVLSRIQELKRNGRKGFAILLDPDKTSPEGCQNLIRQLQGMELVCILVGGSLLSSGDTATLIPRLKAMTDIPIVLFPGNVVQLHDDADGILFLSLISGRNPEFLIGQQVVAAPKLRKSGMEVMPTGYMLIESGTFTTAHYMSNTLPIPSEKADIAACTALAGEMLGLKLIYMDGGSGAKMPVPEAMIKEVSETVDIPLIVGGGIRSTELARKSFEAGADVIVVGTALENTEGNGLLPDLAALVMSYS